MMGRRTRDLLIAAACGAAVAAPALGQGAPAGSFKAQDAGYSGVWRANGTEANTLTVAPGGTVTFGYPSGGSSAHNVKFTDRNPDCTGLPDPTDFQGSRPGWSGSCRFDQPGTYAFMCGFHPDMTGSVVVEAAPMPTSTAPPGGGAATPAPTATPAPATTPLVQSTLAVKLATRQKGAKVRGSVDVKQAGSRLEVAAWAPRNKVRGGRSRAPMRLGRWLKPSVPAVRVRFSVPLAALARSALRRDRRLAVTVKVALVPPGGHKLHRSVRVMLRAS